MIKHSIGSLFKRDEHLIHTGDDRLLTLDAQVNGATGRQVKAHAAVRTRAGVLIVVEDVTRNALSDAAGVGLSDGASDHTHRLIAAHDKKVDVALNF